MTEATAAIETPEETQSPTTYSDSEDFAALFNKHYSDFNPVVGSLVKAKIIDFDKETVTLETLLKSEAFVSKSEFVGEGEAFELNIGDEVEVAIEAYDDGFGETRLSRQRARLIEGWRDLQEAFDEGRIVRGRILERVKGGLTVEINSIRAFLPGSLVDVRAMRDTSTLEGTEQDFLIVKVDKQRNNVVVSRRAVLDKERSGERSKLLDSLVEGAIMKGTVKNLTDYGAFIDLGGIDGLLHITDMSWKRIRHPSEVVEIDQEVEVQVLKFDRKEMRVSLGMRQIQENPWSEALKRYEKGKIYRAKVTNITDYGCFAELESGIEGLVHISEMDWTNRNIHPSKVVTIGNEIDVMLLDINHQQHRISLGIKQCVPNPWEQFNSNYKKGDILKGMVKSITDFGIFIGVDENIDGLVYLSDIDWDLPGEQAIHKYKKGMEVEAMLLGVDVKRERISLGIKQTSVDPFMNFVATHEKGSIVKCKVTEVEQRTVTVELAENLYSVIKASELSQEMVSDATQVVKPDDELEAKITVIDKKNRKIGLSVRARELQQDKESMEQVNSETNAKVATIGDLIKEHMSDS